MIIEKNIFQILKDLNFQNYKHTNLTRLLKYLVQKSGIIAIKICLAKYVSIKQYKDYRYKQCRN